MTGTTTPASPEEITVDWLTRALSSASSPVEVRSVQAVTIGANRGFAGLVARLHVAYSVRDAGLPTTMIAKFPLAGSASPPDERPPLSIERALRELHFYQHGELSSAVPVPRLLYGAAEEGAGRVVLLMEDLGSMVGGDVLVGSSTTQAADVLSAIAPLHARFWRSDTPPWLPRSDSDHARLEERLRQHAGPFLSRFRRDLPAPVVQIIERLSRRCGVVLAALARLPQTVIHGDLHLDNIMFATTTSEAPVAVLDWQTVAVGPAVRDLEPFLISSLSITDRGSALDDLLDLYQGELVRHGSGGYTPVEIHEHFDLALLRHLAGVVTWLGGIDPSELRDRQREVAEAAIGDGRLVAALVDRNVASRI